MQGPHMMSMKPLHMDVDVPAATIVEFLFEEKLLHVASLVS
jgi:hypothetical protein